MRLVSVLISFNITMPLHKYGILKLLYQMNFISQSTTYCTDSYQDDEQLRGVHENSTYKAVKIIGIKDIFECFMMVLNYRSAVLKPRSSKG